MATINLELTGKVKWAKVQAGQADTKFNADGVYTVNFYPQSEKTWRVIERSGIQKKRKTDDDGDFIQLTRNHQALVKGQVQVYGPPRVTYLGETFSGEIGNGSLVIVGVSVYDTKKGKGQRLNFIDIRELVEFNKTISDQDDEIDLPPLD